MQDKASNPDIKFLKTLGLYSIFASISFGFSALTVPHPLSADSFFSSPPAPTGETSPESFESYQMRILKNQNQHQSEKIQSLRTELLEINQKLNELKPHLFKYGDPENEAKIAELNYQLADKERALNDLITAKAYLQMELDATLKKLREMETVKEALAAMIEIQRNAKEQNLASFMKQLEDLQSNAERHKAELFQKILEHESHSEKLAQQVTDKEQTIRRLDTLATQLNKLMSNKEKELQQLKGQVLSFYDEQATIAENHAQEIEKQKQQSNTSHQQWQSWLEAFQGTHAWLLDEIQALHSSLDDEKNKYLQELDAHAQSIENSETTFKQHVETLLSDLEKERSINARFAQLQTDHSEQKKDLDNLNQAYATLQEEMYGHLQQLISSLSEERQNTKLIEQDLVVLFNHHEASQTESEALKNEHQRILEELTQQKKIETALLQHLNQLMEDYSIKERIGQLAVFSDRIWLASDELEIQQIKQDQMDLFEILTGYVQELNDSQANEKAMFAQLSIILDDYAKSSEQASNQKLAEHIDSLKNQHQLIQQRLEDEKLLLQETLAKLTRKFEDKVQQHAHVENQLGYLSDLYQFAQERHLQLDETAELLSRELQEKNQTLPDLEKKIELLSQELQERNQTIPELKEQAELLSQDLQEKNQAIPELEKKIELLSQELQERNQAIPELKEQAELLSQELQEKNQAIPELEKKAELLSQELQERNQAIPELKKQAEFLSQELQEKNQAIPELEKKAELLSQELQERTQTLLQLEENTSLLLQNLEKRNERLSLIEAKLSTLDFHNQSLAEDNQQLQTQKEQLISQIQITEMEISTLKDQVNKMHAQLVKAEILLTDIAHLTASPIQHDKLSEREKEHQRQIRNLQSNLETVQKKNKTLEDDLNYSRQNYVRERNNNQNLENILNEVTDQLHEQNQVATERLAELNENNKQIKSLIHTQETSASKEFDHLQKEYVQLQIYAKELEAGKKALEAESQNPQASDAQFNELKKHYEDLQQHTTELTIQLNNLSEILKEKEVAQMQTEQKSIKMMNKNRELSAEVERLLNQMERFGGRKR